MDLLSLSYDTDTVGILNGTSTSSTSGTSSTSSSLTTGSMVTKGSDDTNFSQGAAMMGKLADLQSSDPDKFKEVTQQISDKLSAAAGNSTDSDQASMLSGLADKFATAASTGSMSSLAPPEAATASGTQGQAALKYSQTGASSGTNPMEAAGSIISDALSSVETASA
jgi:hypothetical protein